MPEVVHMNADDDNDKVVVKIKSVEDLYALGRVHLTSMAEFRREYEAEFQGSGQAEAKWNKDAPAWGEVKYNLLTQGDTILSIKEISKEDYDRIHGKRVVHSGKRAQKQDAWDAALKKTNGEIIYAEQLMVILKDVGGFPLMHTEVVRKAIAKKQPEKIKAYKELFAAELQSGFQDDEIDAMWQKIEEAAPYAFNRSHWFVYHRKGDCKRIADNLGKKCPICEHENDGDRSQ